MPEVICCDIDDFRDEVAFWALPLLDRLYTESQGRFKATLFTIPAHTSPDTLAAAASRSWLELAVHGWTHDGPECAQWDVARTNEVLAQALALGMDHVQCPSSWEPCTAMPLFHTVFKAPHWIAAPGVYIALEQAGWTIADHPRNTLTIPRGLRRYILAPNHAIGVPHNVLPVVQAHGHFTGEGVANGLRENLGAFQALAQWNLPYKWVSEVAV